MGSAIYGLRDTPCVYVAMIRLLHFYPNRNLDAFLFRQLWGAPTLWDFFPIFLVSRQQRRRSAADKNIDILHLVPLGSRLQRR